MEELSWEETNLSRKNSSVVDEGKFVKLLQLLLLLMMLAYFRFGLRFFLSNALSEFPASTIVGFSLTFSQSFSLLVLDSDSSSSFSASEIGLWVFGSIPLSLSFFLIEEFHRFLISLSVLPGNWAAICDHLVKKQKMFIEKLFLKSKLKLFLIFSFGFLRNGLFSKK